MVNLDADTVQKLATFFAALDTTVVATLSGPISSSFQSGTSFSWIASGKSSKGTRLGASQTVFAWVRSSLDRCIA